MAHHAVNNNHTLDFDNAKIIARNNKYCKQLLLEEISKHRVNIRTHLYSNIFSTSIDDKQLFEFIVNIQFLKSFCIYCVKRKEIKFKNKKENY